MNCKDHQIMIGGCPYCMVIDLGNKLVEETEAYKKLSDLYSELIFQVSDKIPGETRHETAKRLIGRTQTCLSGVAKQDLTV